MAKSKVSWIPFIKVKVQGGFETSDVARLLRGFEGPVMVVGAGADHTLPKDLSRSLSRTLADEGIDVTCREYADAGHMDAACSWAFAKDAKVFFAQISDRRPGWRPGPLAGLER
jgi:acetyl esterase/lipase